MTPEHPVPAPQSPPEEPVTIVGAGPAGLACAIVLARAGRKVLVREWHDRVGARFHGDFQGLENWSEETDVLEELEAAGIQATFDRHAVTGGVAFDAWGTSYTLQSSRPLYYLLHRGTEDGSLDRALLAQALSAGVEVRFGDRVERVESSAILAIGPRYADAIAAGYLFETGMGDGSWICFDNSLAPLGYSYLLVHNGRGTIASCMFSGFKQQQTYVTRTVEFFQKRVGLEMRKQRRFGGFGNVRLPRAAVQGNHLVLGEQAGFQDALACFGMRYALRSGILAASSVLGGDNYSAAWHKALLPQMRTGIVNRFILDKVGEHAWRWLLEHRLKHADARGVLSRLYRPSVVTRLLFPLAHWRYRRALHDPSCDHIDCKCVWCECGGAPPHPHFD